MLLLLLLLLFRLNTIKGTSLLKHVLSNGWLTKIEKKKLQIKDFVIKCPVDFYIDIFFKLDLALIDVAENYCRSGVQYHHQVSGGTKHTALSS